MMEGGGVPDPDEKYVYVHSNGSFNVVHYSNSEVDRLLEEARVTPDLETRKSLYHQLTALLTQDLPTFPAFWRPNPVIVQAKFNNVVPSVLNVYSGIHMWCEEK